MHACKALGLSLERLEYARSPVGGRMATGGRLGNIAVFKGALVARIHEHNARLYRLDGPNLSPETRFQ